VDVVVVDLNPIISVASHLFVPHSKRVQDLVNWNSELQDRSHDGKSAKRYSRRHILIMSINHFAGSNLVYPTKISCKTGETVSFSTVRAIVSCR